MPSKYLPWETGKNAIRPLDLAIATGFPAHIGCSEVSQIGPFEKVCCFPGLSF
jgi:hypothetical protein